MMLFKLIIRLITVIIIIDTTRSELFNFNKLYSYVKTFKLDELISINNVTDNNELWQGLLKDCKKRVTFSCIQKNAYNYLDGALDDRDNITLFDGLILKKNHLNYGTCGIENDRQNIDENLIDDSTMKNNCKFNENDDDYETIEMNTKNSKRRGRIIKESNIKSPLEEITIALRQKAMKFLITRDYEIELPKFIFDDTKMKISPREIDDTGALIRLDFTQGHVTNEGRIFKKIKKFIQNKLLFSFLALILIIKLIKVKFFFVIPFLFGVGAAKKLFLKLLLFLIPPLAHIFKLCSSYYTSYVPKYYHHHHQIAHHHHHVPVPVPVPYYDHHHHHHHENDGYDYPHPQMQYRKDVEELKEWGIEPYDDLYDDPNGISGVLPIQGVLQSQIHHPINEYQSGNNYNTPYGLSQYAPNARPIISSSSSSTSYHDKHPVSITTHAHNLAYSGYHDDNKYNRRIVESNGVSNSVKPVNVLSSTPIKNTMTNIKTNYGILNQQNVRQQGIVSRITKVLPTSKNSIVTSSSSSVVGQNYDDEYYGPIINRLEDIFTQLRFYDESCRDRLICSMYKNPTVYSPHSNLVSNELSRDPQELNRGTLESLSSKKFHKYMNAARIGQDHGDCVRKYPCQINSE